MKKMFAALCALLLAPTMASAELISITELVQEIPEAWIEEIDVNGKTISIDAPIYVPEVETLPVLKVTMIEANDDAVQAYVNDGWKVVEGYAQTEEIEPYLIKKQELAYCPRVITWEEVH